MRNILILLIGVVLFAASCADPAKDPLQFDNILKGSLIALRGTAYENLSEAVYRGGIDSVSRTADITNETLTFDADFLSEDITSLREVQVYAKKTFDAARVQVGTIDGASFTVPTDGKYPRGSFSKGYPAILSALGIAQGDLVANQYLYFECDLTLSDGSTVPASSIVNSSLFESDLFYPAHAFQVIIKP
jgi:hypothetical protein